MNSLHAIQRAATLPVTPRIVFSHEPSLFPWQAQLRRDGTFWFLVFHRDEAGRRRTLAEMDEAADQMARHYVETLLCTVGEMVAG